MPSTKTTKHKVAEERTKLVKLQVAPVCQKRAASCPRPVQNRGHSQSGCAHPSRSRSTMARGGRDRAPVEQDTAWDAKWWEDSECPGWRGRANIRKLAIHSHKAFTVIPPNPKKRRDIQKKAEAELAALEELRLSRAMAYVNIQPSSVGGCLSLEEVRLKQQKEMMQAKTRGSRKRCDVIKAA
ncbi:uncharacterized protein LOC109530273 isoform X2 [Hippocampus comes]|uniref:Uncharacterized LOC109530273 n=1 Tax=Hippocampus comes TaxID=109280 RepID=A0A3Q2YZT3_HIPCM|nr:PREDICTED: uncharacterized protein LOC109530273 isoform X2 [Hippocampus comes]